MKARKVVRVHAVVEHDDCEFYVYPNGFVEKWMIDGDIAWPYPDYEADYDAIRAAGLAAIQGE